MMMELTEGRVNFTFVLLTFLIYSFSTSTSAQTGTDFKTILYHENDSSSYELDYFRSQKNLQQREPLMIFVHGGGFSGGTRAHGHPFCKFLADSGINAATISYPLYMKGKNFSCDGIQQEKIKAIHLGAHFARLATAYFIQHADSLNIDTTKVFLAGSSAGAESVLQAAYWDTTAENFYPDTLPEKFKYAGVISGAGAIIDINMISESSKIPTLCYHGTCDPLVPYNIAPHHYCDPTKTGYMMLFGSLAIHKKLKEIGGHTHLMTYCGDGHKHAGTAFYGKEMYTVLDFTNRVIDKEKFTIHRIFEGTDSCNNGLEFEFCSY
ncbi:MAG TPA: alpha/beta hydrolase [Bacteroidales bacterium]|nr:alpha/beta hydrolase [Bacteroidales bacterium]